MAIYIDRLGAGFRDSSNIPYRLGTVEFWESSQRSTRKTAWRDSAATLVIPVGATLGNNGEIDAYGDSTYFIVIRDKDGVEVDQVNYVDYKVPSDLDLLWTDVNKDYGSTSGAINQAITAAGTLNKETFFFNDQTFTIDTNVTFPSNIHVKVSFSAKFIQSNNSTLTFNNTLEAPDLEIFQVGNGALDVVWGSAVNYYKPIWFGNANSGIVYLKNLQRSSKFVTSSTTLAQDYAYYADTTSGDVVFTLPNMQYDWEDGREYYITKHKGSQNIVKLVLSSSGTNKLEGGTDPLYLSENGEGFVVRYSDGEWLIATNRNNHVKTVFVDGGSGPDSQYLEWYTRSISEAKPTRKLYLEGNGDMELVAGHLTVAGDGKFGESVEADDDIITSSGDVIATAGKAIIVGVQSSGDIEATGASKVKTASGNIETATGDIVVTAGDITATAGDILVTAGDITATAGDIICTAGNLITPKFSTTSTGITVQTIHETSPPVGRVLAMYVFDMNQLLSLSGNYSQAYNITSSTSTRIAGITVTPHSTQSYIIIEYLGNLEWNRNNQGTYPSGLPVGIYNDTGGNDTLVAQQVHALFNTNSGAFGLTGTGLPILHRYENSSTSAKIFRLGLWDYGNEVSTLRNLSARITEIAR